jgi:hypothetical protein
MARRIHGGTRLCEWIVKRLKAVSKLAAADVRRRRVLDFPGFPPPHVGGCARIGVLKAIVYA